MEIDFRSRDRHVFMWQSLEIVNVFTTLALKQVFWKTKTFYEKLKYRFLAEVSVIKSAKFPYQSPLLKANVKKNRNREYRMDTGVWTYHKERSFATNCFIFLEILFEYKNRFNYSHQKRKDSLETRAVCSWILILTWNFGGERSDSASTFFKVASAS